MYFKFLNFKKPIENRNQKNEQKNLLKKCFIFFDKLIYYFSTNFISLIHYLIGCYGGFANGISRSNYQLKQCS